MNFKQIPLFLLLLCFAFPVMAQTKDSFYYMKDDGEFSADEKDQEAIDIHGQCARNVVQSAYFNCECIAGAFRQARDSGLLMPQANLLYAIFDSKAKECVNKPGVAGDAYEFCENHSRMFRAREPNNKEFCECVARQSVKEFSKSPKLETDFMSDIQIDALLSCDREY